MAAFPNKPTWMNCDQWSALLGKYGNSPRCELTGSTDNLSVDHIVPRYQGGTDDISNLQFLRCDINSSKGPRDDQYWSRSFFWDQPHNIGGFRSAQRMEAYHRILDYCDWFSRPRSQISRVLYTLAWIVGSGKSLAIPALAFAYNHAILRDRGSAWPRCDRVLVLTKETAVRDQLAADLGGEKGVRSSDLIRYKICENAPRVLSIEDGSQWHTDSFLDQFDLVVACVQQFWDKSGKQIEHIEKILAKFPIIAFDEPHYGDNQVMRIVNSAATSICFGLTGTPIDANGKSIKQFVLFSLYGYDQANNDDGGLKYCAPDEEALGAIIEEIDIDEAEIQHGKARSKVQTPHGEDYDKALIPALTVAGRVVSYVVECDRLMEINNQRAPHRPHDAIPSLWYPVHAMIVADTKIMAENICDSLNSTFKSDRSLYPLEDGYSAEVVTTESFNTSGKIKARPLTTDHPWMIAKNNDGAMKERRGNKTVYASRFLIVVGIGREGVNNPYCGVIGVADGKASAIEHVQRSIGRQLRALTERVDSRLRVPPARLDIIKIITHKTYDIRKPLLEAISFVCNMRDKLKHMQTMEHLMNDDYQMPSGEVLKTVTELTDKDRLIIVARIGSDMLAGNELNPQQIIESFPDRTTEWKQKAITWVQTVRQSPSKANEDLKHDEHLKTVTMVLREVPNCNPNKEALVRFVQIHHPRQVNALNRLDDPLIRDLISEWYQEHVRRFHIADIPRRESLEGIRQWMARAVKDSLGTHFTGPERVVHAFVGSAVKQVLGCADEAASNGSDWDCPQYHVFLTRPEVSSQIIGHVRRKLIARGFCPAIAKALGIAVEDVSDA